ncbi:DUF2470 domain-containing protein [Streptomyces sp. NPDC050856]|uniref:DUF2470 domain-containing protein n=1 Tax=Streptomyces sp. NPDC050856 TaxID=3154939 RepID=UPI0033E1982F
MPSAAERTRTLVQSTCSAVLVVPGAGGARPDGLMPDARVVGADGAVFLLFPAGSPAVGAVGRADGGELPAVLEVTDVAPVAVFDRTRARARVRGRLTAAPGVAGPGHMMLRLDVGEVYVADLWGEGVVGPEEFARAVPDPFHGYETELLQHLHSVHAEQVRGLRGLLGDRAGAGPSAVREVVPLALDRFGLRVRCRDAAGRSFDARFDFPEPAADMGGLRRAMHTLFEAARP